MTEPKYKVYDVVLIPLKNGTKRNAIIFELSEVNKDKGQGYWITPARESDCENFFYESELTPVKIIPIPETKPYCKDCKHYDIWDTDKNIDNECPIVSWMIDLSAVECIQFDETTQPPDNCYCFEPFGKSDKLNNRDILGSSEVKE